MAPSRLAAENTAHKPPHKPPRVPRAVQWTLIAGVVLCIFAVDTVLDLEIAVAVFYASVILAASNALARRGLLALGVLCAALTILSFALGFWLNVHGIRHTGLINLGISLAAIATTTYLVLSMNTARAAAHAAETQLLRIARTRHLAGLTTSIAHEINQPLAAITTSGDACQRWLARQPPDLNKARQALARIRFDADRASHIIARVRGLTRGDPPRPHAFSLNRTITDVLTLSRGELARGNIRVSTRLQPDLPCAWADAVQIQQVIANLLLNAIAALAAAPQQRILTVTTWRHDDTLVATVSDSGAGIAPAVRAHLFDAFWTTKPQGMGVGLSISRALMEANGGRLWLQAQQPGQQGATFAFSVPAASGKTSESTPR